MNFKFKHTEKIVGIFVILAFLLLIGTIISISISKKMFIKTFSFKTKLSDAEGLSTSTPINFKGYVIGKVKKFLLDADNNIDVDFVVYKDFRDKVVVGSAIYRQVNPISGGMSLILLYPNKLPVSLSKEGTITGLSVLPEGGYVPSLDMWDGRKLLEDKMIEKSGDSISILFEDARDFVSNLRQEVRLKQDSFQMFFKNIADVAESLARNSVILDHINLMMNPQNGPVFTTLNTFTEISARLKDSVNQLNTLIDNYKNPDGLMVKMFQLNQVELNQMIQNVNKNLESIQEMMKAIKEQAPMLADLLNETDKTLKAVNNNPLLRGGIPREDKNNSTSKKKRMDIDR